MREFFFWWAGVEGVGLAAFPLVYVFFRRLPDRGFAFTKPVGLLLLGYGLWAGALADLLPNNRTSVILLLLLIAGLSAVAAVRHRWEMIDFFRSGWRYIAFVEAMFFAVLAGAVFIRSFAPEIVWGEKPFELAFLNSISRSESFPPADPWLAGHSISYYYFGYVIVAALSKLVALGTNVTFYLGLSLMAALAAVAAFGLVYNLIAASRRAERAQGPTLVLRAVVFGLAGAGLMLIVSNLAGVFELMARHGVGSEGFYGLVGIYGLDGPYDCAAAPGDCSAWYPTRYWWWWWATRMGSPFDIQEFPFFSFQFGDLHPHVLVMPFLITLFAVAFQVVMQVPSEGRAVGTGGSEGLGQRGHWLVGALLLGGMAFTVAWATGLGLGLVVLLTFGAVGLQMVVGAVAGGPAGEGEEAERLDALWWLRRPQRFLLLAIFLGGIAFIDAWAMPLAILMVPAAVTVANWLRASQRPLHTLADSVGFAAPLVAAMFFFYLPFYVNLETDTRGLSIIQTTITTTRPPPNSESTRPLHFLLFWSPLLWIALSFIAVYVYRRWRQVLKPLLLALSVLAWAVPVSVWALVIALSDGLGALADEFWERGASLITVLLLIVAITAVALSFLHQLRRPVEEQDRGQLFAFYLAGFAFLMLLGAEFYFVNDVLGWRGNTVFRFWHQGWIILSIVGGFGLYRLTLSWRPPALRMAVVPWRRLSWLGVTAVILAAALVYPVTVTFERTGGFRNPQSLNGLVHVQRSDPQEYEAIQWLNRNVAGTPVILEAVGRDFSAFARVSSRTGLPTVMGWLGHEIQWRGQPNTENDPSGETPFTDRPDEVDLIYGSADVQEAKALLEKYDVEYVYVGRLERQRYGEESLAKFRQFMTPVFENGGVTIYRTPTATGTAARSSQ